MNEHEKLLGFLYEKSGYAQKGVTRDAFMQAALSSPEKFESALQKFHQVAPGYSGVDYGEFKQKYLAKNPLPFGDGIQGEMGPPSPEQQQKDINEARIATGDGIQGEMGPPDMAQQEETIQQARDQSAFAPTDPSPDESLFLTSQEVASQNGEIGQSSVSVAGMDQPVSDDREFNDPMPDLSKGGYAQSTPGENAVTLYNWDTFEKVQINPDELKQYYKDVAKSIYGNEIDPEDMTPEQLNAVVGAVSAEYIEEGALNEYMNKNGYSLDPNMIHTYGAAIGRGVLGTSSAISQGMNELAMLISNKTGMKTGGGFRQLAEDLNEARASLSMNPKFESFGTQVAEGLGSSLPFLAGGVAGGVAGGSGVGTATTAISGSLANIGQLSEDERYEQLSDTEKQMAILARGVIGASEAIPLGRIAGKFRGKGLSQGTSSKLMGALKEGVEEAVQEASVEMLNNLTAREIYDASQEILTDEVLQGGAVGAATGLLMGGLAAGVGSLAERAQGRDKALLKSSRTLIENAQEVITEESEVAQPASEAQQPEVPPAEPGTQPSVEVLGEGDGNEIEAAGNEIVESPEELPQEAVQDVAIPDESTADDVPGIPESNDSAEEVAPPTKNVAPDEAVTEQPVQDESPSLPETKTYKLEKGEDGRLRAVRKGKGKSTPVAQKKAEQRLIQKYVDESDFMSGEDSAQFAQNNPDYVPASGADPAMQLAEISSNAPEIANAIILEEEAFSQDKVQLSRHAIASHISKVTEESLSRFGDPNKVAMAIGRNYIAEKGDPQAVTIDQIAQAASFEIDPNDPNKISPEEVWSFIEDFPSGADKFYSQVAPGRKVLMDKLESILGFRPNSRQLDQIADQYYEEEANSEELTDEIFETGAEGVGPVVEEEVPLPEESEEVAPNTWGQIIRGNDLSDKFKPAKGKESAPKIISGKDVDLEIRTGPRNEDMGSTPESIALVKNFYEKEFGRKLTALENAAIDNLGYLPGTGVHFIPKAKKGTPARASSVSPRPNTPESIDENSTVTISPDREGNIPVKSSDMAVAIVSKMRPIVGEEKIDINISPSGSGVVIQVSVGENGEKFFADRKISGNTLTLRTASSNIPGAGKALNQALLPILDDLGVDSIVINEATTLGSYVYAKAGALVDIGMVEKLINRAKAGVKDGMLNREDSRLDFSAVAFKEEIDHFEEIVSSWKDVNPGRDRFPMELIARYGEASKALLYGNKSDGMGGWLGGEIDLVNETRRSIFVKSISSPSVIELKENVSLEVASLNDPIGFESAAYAEQVLLGVSEILPKNAISGSVITEGDTLTLNVSVLGSDNAPGFPFGVQIGNGSMSLVGFEEVGKNSKLIDSVILNTMPIIYFRGIDRIDIPEIKGNGAYEWASYGLTVPFTDLNQHLANVVTDKSGLDNPKTNIVRKSKNGFLDLGKLKRSSQYPLKSILNGYEVYSGFLDLKNPDSRNRLAEKVGFNSENTTYGEQNPVGITPRASSVDGNTDAFAGQEGLKAMIRHLQGKFPGSRVSFDQMEFDAAATRNGMDPKKTRAFVRGNHVYFNPSLTRASEPLHEFSHIWILMMRNTEPNFYRQFRNVIQGSTYYEDASALFPEGSDVDEIAMEAMAIAISEKGVKRLRDEVGKSELRKMIDKFWRMVSKAMVSGLNKIGIVHTWDNMSLSDFLGYARNELFTPGEIAYYSDLGIPEFNRVAMNTFEGNVPKGKEETFYEKWRKSNSILKGVEFDPSTNPALINFRIIFQDKRIKLRKIQEAIQETGGKILSSNLDVYGFLDTMPGRVMYEVEQMEEKLYGNQRLKSKKAREESERKSLMGRVKSAGITWFDFSTYLYARHAEERNAAIARKQIDALDPEAENYDTEVNRISNLAWSGMNRNEANEILRKVAEGGKQDLYQGFADEYQNMIIKPIRQMARSAGLIDEESYNALDTSFKHYVPLLVENYRGEDGSSIFLGSTSEVTVKGTGIKSLRSKKSFQYRYWDRADVVYAGIKEYTSMLARIEQNKALTGLAQLVESNPDPNLWEITDAFHSTEFDPETGQHHPVFKQKLSAAEEARRLSYFVDGKIKQIEIKDPQLLKAFKPDELKVPMVKVIHRYLNQFTKWRRTVLTTLSPSFAIPNFIADFVTALTFADALIPGQKRGAVQRAMIQNLPGAVRAYRNREMGVTGSTKYDRYLGEMIESGGYISWVNYDGVDVELGKSQRTLKQVERREKVGNHNFVRYGKDKLIAVRNTIELFNGITEQATRISAYVAARESGISAKEAAQISKNISVNFNRKGSISWFMNSLYLFSNAGIQGTHMMLRYARTNKKVQQNLAIVALLGFMESLLNDLWTEDDDMASLITNEEKRTQVNFGFGDKIVRFRIGYGMNIFKVLGNQIYDVSTGKTSAARGVSEVFMTSEMTMNPLSSDQGLVYMFIPDVGKPVYEISNNETFGGVPIVPENMFGGVEKPKSQRHFSNVGRSSKAFTDWLHRITGGTDEISGFAEVSPEYMDYMYNWLTGGTGKFVANSGETIGNLFRAATGQETDAQRQLEREAGVPFNPNKLPVARRFYEDMSISDWRSGRIFTDMVENAENTTFTDSELHKLRYVFNLSYERYEEDGNKRAAGRVKSRYKDVLKVQKERRVRDGFDIGIISTLEKRVK